MTLLLQLLAALDWFFTGFLHTASYGDGFREAPDAELILPKIEPIAEEIKYKLLDVVIEEGDITLMDRDILTRIQVCPYTHTRMHSHARIHTHTHTHTHTHRLLGLIWDSATFIRVLKLSVYLSKYRVLHSRPLHPWSLTIVAWQSVVVWTLVTSKVM